MGSRKDFTLGYFMLFDIKHLKKCTQTFGSFHKSSYDFRPTMRDRLARLHGSFYKLA